MSYIERHGLFKGQLLMKHHHKYMDQDDKMNFMHAYLLPKLVGILIPKPMQSTTKAALGFRA